MKKLISLISCMLLFVASNYSQVAKTANATISIPSAILRSTPSETGAVVQKVKINEKVTLFSEVSNGFVKATYKGSNGFLKTGSVKQSAEITKFIKDAQKPVVTTKPVKPTTKADKASEKPAKVADSYFGMYNGNKVFLGPKGGKYYLNKNNKKTYLTPAQLTKVTK